MAFRSGRLPLIEGKDEPKADFRAGLKGRLFFRLESIRRFDTNLQQSKRCHLRTSCQSKVGLLLLPE